MQLPIFDIQCIIPSADTGGAMAAFKETAKPGEGPPMHVHRTQTEVFHVIEGVFEFTVNGQSLRLGPGGSAVVPPGTPHRFECVEGERGVLHFELLPAENAEEFFRVLTESPSPVDDIPAFFARHGIELV
jgi:quercetin dioxygenase-like cupin family protein